MGALPWTPLHWKDFPFSEHCRHVAKEPENRNKSRLKDQLVTKTLFVRLRDDQSREERIELRVEECLSES